MKTIEQYAVDLITDGAESLAEDDLNENEDIADNDHDAATDLAVKMAHAIKNNPAAFLAWFRLMPEVATDGGVA